MKQVEERYISLLTDFGFKRIFGTAMNKDLLICFLNSLFNGKQVVKDVSYLNPEHVGDVYTDRRAIFDVYCESEIPFTPLWCLFTNRESGVKKGTILEIRLVGILHFNDELLAVFALTIYIEDGSAVGIDISHMLRVQIRYVLHNLSAIKQAVEEANEQILVHCCSKNSLETEVGQQADVSFFYLLHNHLF